MCQGFRQAVRQITRRRSHGLTVALVMALSVGASVAIFAMVNAVLLADLGFADSSRLAILWHARPNAAGVIGVSPGDHASYRATLRTFKNVAVVSTRDFNLGGGAAPARVSCARLTADMFPMLGIAPSQGRWFTPDDESARLPVVVVSHRLWTTHLAGNAEAVGSDLMLDAVRYRIVGIMPEAFTFPPAGVQGLVPADCWVPASFSPAELATPAFNHVIVARLKDGESWANAQRDAEAGAHRIWSSYPAAVQAQVHITARVVPLEEQTRSRSRTPLYVFMAAAIGLFVIGCANVSNLLVTSFEARQGEFAVRASVGATRWALVSQLLAESLLLTTTGSVLGLVLAEGLLSAMIATNAAAFPRLVDARIDGAAALFALGCGLLAGVVATLPPAWRVVRRSPPPDGPGARRATRGFAGNGWRRSVIALELALAVSVLVLAGVLVRSVDGLNRVDVGFVADNLSTFAVALPAARYQTAEQIAAMRVRLLQRLATVGRIEAVAISSAPPIGDAQPGVVSAGNAGGAPEYQPALVHHVTPEWGDTLHLAMRSGRFIESVDAVDRSATVAVVNESLARVLYPDGGAVGRPLSRIGAAQPLTIVGIVDDVRQGGPLRPPPPALYVPFSDHQQPVRTLHVALRTQAPGVNPSQIRRAVADVDAELPAFAIRSGVDLVNGAIAGHRFNMLVVGVFAMLALLVAIAGVYSVLAHAMQQSLRDFGIRQALGATSTRIVRSVLLRALAPAVIGIGVGTLVASAASGLIASLLFGVRPTDPLTLAAVALLVLILCVAAVLTPTMRALRINLVTLLRHD